ncbi:cation:dicarboxylase symporter family transporter [Simiduia curdlanivorans]|uniref:Cation:dicarboxylate symporter family transporter n=1 Tax=Simiduia curdlanivorans TaxID=1492769 RepID=A0ABV8V4X9_9GAMM|nr:cation:dicarboxylase symporter family transporter [Simiduia curdlanivorans]MDN3637254.1 cation:dicarboxylase symporter family transporter [Simiduia curdlanivorans]
MSLSTKIILGLLLGLAAGVGFGERMTALNIVGDIFLGLLQMTVLPYIMVSLVAAVGALNRGQAKALAKYGALVLAILWGFTLVLIALATLSFPDWTSASYFSPSMLEPAQRFDFLANFLPANIFSALGAGAVPAVVVFSLFLGVAVLRLGQNNDFLKLIDSLQSAIGEMAALVMKTAPVGVFAIAASAAGTLELEDLKGLYVYLVTLTLLCLVLTFWLFPMLVKTLTKWRYSEVLNISKDALITAFATGNLFIVLPIIAENTRKLFLRSYEHASPQANLVEVVVPAAFSLPVAGKLMALLFVLFAGWFGGEPVAIADYPQLLLSGLVNLFGSSFNAVPSLLHSYKIPAEFFELFLVSENIISNRLGAMTSVMFVVVLAILVASGADHKWRWSVKALLRFVVATLLLVVVMSLTLRSLYKMVGHDYTAYSEFISRDLLLTKAPSKNTLQVPAVLPQEPAGNTLARIQARKLLRVGYFRDWLPYAFHNQQGDLVGLDVEIWHQLARDLGVAVEFVRVYRKDAKRLLDARYLDMTAGVAMTPSAIANFTLAAPHYQESLALLVRKSRRTELREWQEIGSSNRLRLGVPNTYYLAGSLHQALPNWRVAEISSPREFLRGDKVDLDAVIFGAAGASAWTLLYPEFAVVVPQPALPAVPMAMPLSSNDLEFVLYMSQWFQVRRADGTLTKLTDYWIRGKRKDTDSHRWNLWDDVIRAPASSGDELAP